MIAELMARWRATPCSLLDFFMGVGIFLWLGWSLLGAVVFIVGGFFAIYDFVKGAANLLKETILVCLPPKKKGNP